MRTNRRQTMFRYGVFSFVLLLLLAACGESHEQMLRQLEELERMNRADSVMQNDTLAEQLVRYFDRHGDANERMRAHYILGRTYADMGEAPAAINAYLDAADCADTTATDCDYHTLSRVYGQMADVFYWQNLMADYLNACDKSIEYSWKDCDTMHALNIEAHKVAAYNRLKQNDKVITTFDNVYNQLIKTYGIATTAKYCTLPVNALLEEGEYEKAGEYLSIVEQKSGYFDSAGNIEKGREGFYYYKGRYLLAIGQPDSAEYYFRKELRTGLDVTNQSMASRGLSLVFSQTGRVDSALKYALYSYEMNDSAYSQMATMEVENAKASHDYSRSQLLADKESLRAEREEKRAQLYFFVIVLAAIAGACATYYMLKQKRAHERARRDIEERQESAIQELLVLRQQAKRTREQIETKEGAVSQDWEGLDELRSTEARLRQMVAQKEEAFAELNAEYEKYRSHVEATVAEKEKIMQEAPIYSIVHKKADSGKKLSDDELSLLHNLVREALPAFYQFVSSKEHSLNETEFNACVLLRLHVRPSSVAALLGKSKSTITKACGAVMEKVFNENGLSHELIEKLKVIC